MMREEAIAYFKRHLDLYCVDGISREAEEMAIEALEQQPCEDAVSRQAVLDLIEHYNSDGLGSVFNGYEEGVKFADAVNELPSVTPQQKTGHWIYSKAVFTGEIIWSECSVCGAGEHSCAKRMKFCPNCGAKMIESEG